MSKELYRKLPKVDKLLNSQDLIVLSKEMDYHSYLDTIKLGIEFFREAISKSEISDFQEKDVINKIIEIGSQKKIFSLRKVINGTGTILHTNLGRALYTEKMVDQMLKISTNYNNLEYDLETGSRGSRYSHLEELICKVTGAEGALVVNNNAAAVVISLNELAKGKETIVSRGELVEIGGSFRIPDIMELSGTTLVEVGTTNRTNYLDYEKAINEKTGLLLKVHSSNYKMTGFVKSVHPEEISEIGKKHSIITMEDIGSGVLIDFSKYGITKEPTVQESIQKGIDIVTFSGDKLLGGPQAGIIIGKKELIDRIAKNQYMRTFRLNKNAIAALEVLFKYYLDEREAIKKIPTLRMILENSKEVEKKAIEISKILFEKKVKHEVIETEAKIGGGSMPEETVKSYGLAFPGNPNKLEQIFRKNNVPIIGRIYENKFVIDLKTVQNKDIVLIVEEIEKILYPKEINS